VFSIETENLTRCYGRRRGIDSVTLRVPPGSLFGFLGPNGAGKTTTIRVVLGFLRPTSGAARVFGQDAWRDSAAIKREVGYLPGDLRLYPWMTGQRALHIFGAARGRDLRADGAVLAERFSMDMRVRVRDMSRGMRQKLGLILALVHRPKLLVLDEPTASLDPLMQEELRTHLRELAHGGTTVFFSSHTLGEVEQLCDRVAIVRDGKIVADEALETLRKRAGHQVTIRWPDSDSARFEPPAFLQVLERDQQQWRGLLEGSVNELLTWLAPKHVEDLTIERPDLETLFRKFYGGSERRL